MALAATLGLLLALVLPGTAAQAAGSTDLTVSLSGPSSGTLIKTGTYRAVVKNVGGPTAADGATVSFDLDDRLNLQSLECVDAGGGATCADASVSGSVVTLSRFPVGGSVTLDLTVQYGARGGASLQATVQPPAGVSDANPSTNVAKQGITITDPVPLALTVTGTGPETAALGERVTRTFTVKNEDTRSFGAGDITVSASDWSAGGKPGPLTLTCLSVSVGTCPGPVTGEPGAAIDLPLSEFPPGATARFETTVAYAVGRCTEDGSGTGWGQLRLNLTTEGVLAESSVATVGVPLNGVATCPRVNLSAAVSDVPTDLGADGQGEVVITYTNHADEPTPARIRRQLPKEGNFPSESSTALSLKWNGATCTSTGGALCPTDLAVDTSEKSYDIEMPAHSTVTLRYAGTITQHHCAYSGTWSYGTVFASISPLPDDEGIHNVNRDDSVYNNFRFTGAEICPKLDLETHQSNDELAWVGTPTQITQTFTNTGDSDARVLMSDAGVGNGSPESAGVKRAVVTCVSTFCPPAYPRNEPIDAPKGRMGLYHYEDPFTLPAGESIVLKKQVTPDVDSCPSNGELTLTSSADLLPAEPLVEGGYGYQGRVDVACHDDSVSADFTGATPGNVGSLELAVANSGGPERKQSVTATLPAEGLFVDPALLDSARCTRGPADVPCPTISYDAASHSLSFDVADQPVGGVLTVAVPLTLGVKPASRGSSYTVSTTVSSGKGEATPASNTATNNVGIHNTPVASSLSIKVTGPAARALTAAAAAATEIPVRGVIDCAYTDDTEVTGVVAAGTSELRLDGPDLYPGDSCFVRLDAVAGASWVGGDRLPAQSVGSDPVDFSAELLLDTPVDPGTDADADADGTDTDADADGTTANADASTDGTGTDADADGSNADAAADGTDTDAAAAADGTTANADASTDGTGTDPSHHAGEQEHLPQTGATVMPLVLAAGVLVLGGAAFLLIRRGSRRRG